MLWRVAKDLAEFSPRDAELLYQSTLDSISQSWCINHYPVAEYLVAARRELFAKGLVPSPVEKTLQKQLQADSCPQAEAVLLAGEVSELGDKSAADPALKLLEKCGETVRAFVVPTGALAYALGDIETARGQAAEIAKVLEQAGVKRVVADGPQTMYALKRSEKRSKGVFPGQPQCLFSCRGAGLRRGDPAGSLRQRRAFRIRRDL